jgi:DNA-binding NtrC family response regulator
VLRWAHKILEQESTQSDRRVLGFTPDAEQALLQHKWPGNISEMRAIIHDALARTDKDWVTPVDLGLFVGISADGHAAPRAERSFLESRREEAPPEPEYKPSGEEEVRLALGQALAASIETASLRPLGVWLDDEIIDAALARSGGDSKGAAEFLQVRTRNIGRWIPKVREREAEREASLLWQPVRERVQQWVLEAAPAEVPLQHVAELMLLSLVQQQCAAHSVAERARILGVSTPTYQKRLKQLPGNG